MRRIATVLFFLVIPIHSTGLHTTLKADEWPWWRGPSRDGVARGATPPLEWDEKKVIWRSPIPGRGHSTPAISKTMIFLTSADEKTKERWACGYARDTGKQVWQRKLHVDGFDSPGQSRRSWANCSPAYDGERVLVLFSWQASIWATALDPSSGKTVWQKKVGPFTSHHGYSASPTVWKSSFLIAADHKKGGYLAALDRASGKILWKTDRPPAPSYVAPIVLPIAGRDQLVLSGCDLIAAYNPDTGKELWRCKATTTECVGSVIGFGDLLFASGGYPDHLTTCVRAGDTPKVLWTKPVRTYIPSMLVYKKHLFTVTDRGIAYCWDAETGEEKWKGRLGGSFAASPSRHGDRIYATSEQGTTYVFAADPEKFEKLAENQLGDETFASPVFLDGKVYLRIATRGESRQEELVCVGG